MNVVKHLRFAVLFALSLPVCAWSGQASPDYLLADAILDGCAIQVVKYRSSSPSADTFNLNLDWRCSGKHVAVVDTYPARGSSPEIVTVFFTKMRDVIVLVKWVETWRDSSIAHYKVFAYRYVGDPSAPFAKREQISQQFGDGFDSFLNGERVDYPFKTASAIRQQLSELGE